MNVAQMQGMTFDWSLLFMPVPVVSVPFHSDSECSKEVKHVDWPTRDAGPSATLQVQHIAWACLEDDCILLQPGAILCLQPEIT